MKKIIVIFSLTILAVSCESKNPKAELTVGMTYDEVENVLGKPTQISRGLNEFEPSFESLPHEVVLNINLKKDETKNSEKRWYMPNKLNVNGSLIYVSWIYNKINKDTFYVELKTDMVVNDTSYFKIEYEVTSKKTVIFDTACGRVTSFGFYPEKVSRITPLPYNRGEEIRVEF